MSIEEQEKVESINNYEKLIKDAEIQIAKAKMERDYKRVQNLIEYVESLFCRIQGAQYA